MLMDDTLTLKNCGHNHCRKGVDEKPRNVMPSTNVNNVKKSSGDVEKPRNAQAYPNRCHSSKSVTVLGSGTLWLG
ncbi:hypothetical protein V2G26_007789 [Clonostachys chloroleuca]